MVPAVRVNNGVWLHPSVDSDRKVLALARRAEAYFIKNCFVPYKILNTWHPAVVVWESGEPVGVIVYNDAETFVNLTVVYVKPSRRGNGYLRSMLHQVPIDKPLAWSVHVDNHKAILAYLRVGATAVRTSRDDIVCSYDRRALGLY
jgi:hypothetical protein